MSRSKLNDDPNTRDASLTIRLPSAELASWKKAAAKVGLPLPTLARRMLMADMDAVLFPESVEERRERLAKRRLGWTDNPKTGALDVPPIG